MDDSKINTSDVNVAAQDSSLPKFEAHTEGEVRETVLLRDFNLWSTLGIGFSYIATPLSVGTYLAFSLSAGGSPYFFYGYVVCFVFQTLVVLSLAEIAGFLPHTSGRQPKPTFHGSCTDSSPGQIFWTSQLAPPAYARPLSYFTGAFTMMAWTFWTAATFLFTAQLVLAFVQVCGATWDQEDYQVFLLYVACSVYGFFMNTWGFKIMPFMSKVMIGYVNLGALFILIALLARATPKPSARQVFVDIVNETGWSSDGMVFFLALLPGLTALNGFDSAAHMSDEVPHPAKQIPRVMVGLVLLCGFAGLPMVIAVLFSVTNPDNLLTSAQPIFQLFHDSMRSLPLAILSCLIYLGLFFFACGSIVTTLSRVWWSFSRMGSLPWAQWQGHLTPGWLLPVNSIIVVSILEVFIGLLIFGPTTVLYGITGSAAVCFFFSYMIPIVCLLIKGRKSLPKSRYFNLGRLGPVINIISLAWAALVTVFLCFPTYYPVTTTSMNYASAAVAVGLFLFALMWIFHARKHYVVPGALLSSEYHEDHQGATVVSYSEIPD
ncbi:hypothetical protein PV08_04022 [Exophiala spinifera]|uniref:Amino acid permease/ SLC12A domain-containing protein n=1 Tax=Exophiala spinifera TaxID=91928 RepID=A0A0D1ZVU9_9EURO|nr:uncharacterized protein PV08_04022 [Exophiala spinifera]KIW16832.1 hypothetical protein PV08_04022 [Exophiala spinifera]